MVTWLVVIAFRMRDSLKPHAQSMNDWQALIIEELILKNISCSHR